MMQKQNYLKVGIALVVVLSLFLVVGIAAAQQEAGNAGCDAFLTNDRGIKRVTEIAVLVLDELELEQPEA